MTWFSSLGKDLKYACRTLLKSPGFALAALLVLALGIGANTAIFTVVDAVLLRPFPLPESDRLVTVWHTPPPQTFKGMRTFSVSPANYFDWEAQNQVFERSAIYGFTTLALTGVGEPEAIVTAVVQSTFFSTLSVQPALGRNFLPEEEQKGRDKVVILSDALWRSRFGADPSIIGRAVQIGGEPRTVVGVMPAHVKFPADMPITMWVPLGWDAEERAVRSIHDYMVIARLKPGVSVAQAQSEMDTISKRLEQQYPADNANWGALVEPLRDTYVAEARPALLMMLGAVAFVLLIACANVANLVLARALSRQKEIAIRTALGASRARLLQQVLLETVLLALGGGLLGLWLARLGVDVVVNFLGESITSWTEVRLDASVLVFTLVISVFAGLIAGLIPALRLSKANVHNALKEGLGRSGADSGGAKTRNALVTVEVALSLMLLVGAALTVRSLWKLRDVDAGIDHRNVLTMRVGLGGPQYAKPEQVNHFANETLRRIRSLPGVESAGLATSLPVVHGGSTQPFVREGETPRPLAEQEMGAVRIISPGYLPTVRVPLLRGRDFTDSDGPNSKPVAIISSAMAKQYWPDQDPIGKRFKLSFVPEHTWEIVGVVGDVRMQGLESDRDVPTIYISFAQNSPPYLIYLVRTKTEPHSLASAAVAQIRSVDPLQPVRRINSMEELLAESIAQRRFNMLLLTVFAALALVLASVGIYSVLAYTVRLRLREIGIRMALGADTAKVLRLVVGEGMRPTLIGMAVGVAGALALGRVLVSLVYGVSASDPFTITAMALLLIFVGLLASVVPAYRATRVDPAAILRDE